MTIELCKSHISSRSSRSGFTPLRYQCERVVKFKVTYKEAARGKTVTEYVCAIHKNSLEKLAKRILKKTGYDVKMIIEPIKTNL